MSDTKKKNSRQLYEAAQERLIASLLAEDTENSSINRILELITEEDIEDPIYGTIFRCMGELSRTNIPVSIISVSEELNKRGELLSIGGIPALYDLSVKGQKYLLDSSTEIYARIIKESSAKSKIVNTINESIHKFDDDSGVPAVDAVSDLQSYFNEKLLNLSDSSTVSHFNQTFDEYLNILDERLRISKENEENAGGLQGIPSLLPSLNKYTTGWLPGQLITVGAKTGVGKALALDTPILTTNGWSTMEKLEVGEYVFGRDGNPTKIIAATEVMSNRDCYEITFHNGEKIVADAQHMWIVSYSDKEHIITTEELFFKQYEEQGRPFKITQKDKTFFIENVSTVKSVPVRCIQVDNADHTYLAGSTMIPTHNSILAVDCAVAACKANASVMFFSLEMGEVEIKDRILAATTGITLNNLKQGRLTEQERTILETQLKNMKDTKLIIDVEPKITVDMIRARALKQAQSADGLDFIIVDYLQLITPTGRFSNRQEAVSDISRNMKLLAKQLGVPIMVLVQLNREKDEENALPKLEHIRESGAIAQDSDIVILLHRDIRTDDITPPTLVILAKNRGGEANKIIHTHSNLECSLFREITRVNDVKKLADKDEDSYENDDDIDLGFDDDSFSSSFDDDMDL